MHNTMGLPTVEEIARIGATRIPTGDTSCEKQPPARLASESGSNQGPITVPESSLQRRRWLPVPLNVNQLPLNRTLTR